MTHAPFSSADPRKQIPFRNAAGVGLGNGIGTWQLGYPGQTCLEGCLGLLRGGDLSELNYTEPPSEVIPSS
jgi:hypothetical protein